MKIGKLTNAELEDLILSKFINIRKEVAGAPKIGADCAYIDLHSACVVSSDPITAATSRIGYLTVHVNCNDAAAAGAEPVGLTVSLLAPPSATKEQLSCIADEISNAAKKVNIDIVGGHTEITDAVTRIITSATIIAKPITKLKGKMQEGDSIVMTKWAGIEGTFVIANDIENGLCLSEDELQSARSLIDELSVVPEGKFAAGNGAVAMHDITEGGVLGAVWELSSLSKIGCKVFTEKIPVLDVTQKICDEFSINPLRLISSGSMLIACPDGERMVAGLESIGVKATIIGKATGSSVTDEYGNIIEPPEADEIYKVLKR